MLWITLKAEALNCSPCNCCLSFSNKLIETRELTNIVPKKYERKINILKNDPIVEVENCD